MFIPITDTIKLLLRRIIFSVNRYYAYKERMNWNDAKTKCEERRMTLAKINSLKQNFDATRSMFQADPIDMASMRQYYSDDNWVG